MNPDAKVGGVEPEFLTLLHSIKYPKVLEIGTCRSNPDFPTHHLEWMPNGATLIMSDAFPGIDVDIVSDAHDLKEFETGSFDAVIAISVFEHLAKPWIASEAIARVLKPGGLVYIATHQTFPLHGYPYDYFRFSTDALEVLFGKPLYEEVKSAYEFPCKIIPHKEVKTWNTAAPCFLNVGCYAIRSDKEI